MLIHGIGFDHCQRALFREEEVDLSFGLLVTFAAMQLVDRLVLHSKLGPQTVMRDSKVSIKGGIRLLVIIYI